MALGFEKNILELANPEKDPIGIYRKRQRPPERVRPASPENDLHF